eukprot:NODE_224_length_1978_cov_137.666148_g161_i1.p1 GENE.NODE_224_length_1978_cov_137.666148_g161_i1~~NODE_224_length_1978_cov_137.666148_g161_i1.p1  ORF type:complete len:322 (+),score=72.69 NODE_224_length_1978_cov_137.666148_g161_i1:557-1522(+)
MIAFTRTASMSCDRRPKLMNKVSFRDGDSSKKNATADATGEVGSAPSGLVSQDAEQTPNRPVFLDLDGIDKILAECQDPWDAVKSLTPECNPFETTTPFFCTTPPTTTLTDNFSTTAMSAARVLPSTPPTSFAPATFSTSQPTAAPVAFSARQQQADISRQSAHPHPHLSISVGSPPPLSLTVGPPHHHHHHHHTNTHTPHVHPSIATPAAAHAPLVPPHRRDSAAGQMGQISREIQAEKSALEISCPPTTVDVALKETPSPNTTDKIQCNVLSTDSALLMSLVNRLGGLEKELKMLREVLTRNGIDVTALADTAIGSQTA